MNETGTQEAKRRRKAMPPALKRPMPLGCLASLAVYLAVCIGVFAGTHSVFALVFGSPAALVLAGLAGWHLYGLALLATVRTRREVRCLVVYSNSPTWRDHIRTGWLPRIGAMAIVLDWSERASWRSTLETRLFRRFCGERRNFNPAVIVFRGLKEPYVFRFFYAFQELKVGRPQYLEMLEAEMFKALGLDRAA